MIAGSITTFPSKSFLGLRKASLGLNHFWDFFKRLKKGSFGLEMRFYLGLSFIGRIFLEKVHGVYSDSSVRRANNRFPSKGFFRPWKAFLSWFELHWTYISQENTWSIFARTNNQISMIAGRITSFPSKRLISAFEKRVYLGLSLIGRIFLEKIHGVYSRGRITRFECSPGEWQIPLKKLPQTKCKAVLSGFNASLDVYFLRKYIKYTSPDE